MNSGIRIIKRGTSAKPNSVRHAEKTEQERERETATTIQSWVADWEERKRSLQRVTFAFVHGLDQSRQTSVEPVTVN